MKHVGISDDTYQAIAAQTTDISAFLEQAAKRHLAKQRFESSPAESRCKDEDLVERFRQYRGMLKSVTIEDLVESRHVGLL